MAPARVRCPSCRREVRWEGNRWRPFCSERCRTLDLGAWAAEKYRIPADETTDPVRSGDEEEDAE